jgi:phosphohistidine swiveling domain-containing protein
MSTTARIPLPSDLPAPWEQPEDEQAFWTSDPMHFPNPMTKLDYMLGGMIYGPGMNHAFETYEIPLRADSRRFWTHLYTSISPLMLPEDEVHAMGQRSEEKLGAVMGRLMERWETDWLPEVKQHLDYWERLDLQGATTAELLAYLDETVRRLQRIWAVHFELVFPVQLPVSLFDEFYRDLFGDENPFAAYALVQGFDNLTVRAGTELWKLSRKAQASPVVRAVLEEREAEGVLSALEETEDGRAFLVDLHAYLSEYGQRGSIWGLSYPSWIEDPTPAIKSLKDYITQPDRDPEHELAQLAAEREQLIAAARERLQSYPEPVRNQFEFLLKAAQDGNVLSEDHGFWIDFRACYQARRVFMEFGRRFAEAGMLERADDIAHLTPDEIRATAAALPEVSPSCISLVNERKAEIARFATVNVPPAVGTQPPGPPPVNPMTQLLGKFFGTPPQPSSDPSVLHGSAGSPGVARGPACVVRSLADASRLRPGDILVAETTAPPWTPLFATAAAVVTDTGGILSHCAVVAREYRIPAVVGTGMSTVAIPDGALIEVDGDRGTVRIVG